MEIGKLRSVTLLREAGKMADLAELGTLVQLQLNSNNTRVRSASAATTLPE